MMSSHKGGVGRYRLMFLDIPNTKHTHWRSLLVDYVVIDGNVGVGGGSLMTKKIGMNILSIAVLSKLVGIIKYRGIIHRMLGA